MQYYDSNGLYKYITGNDLQEKYVFFAKNLWQLVYGNSNSEPKILVVASYIGNQDLKVGYTEEELRAFKTLSFLSNRTGLPLILVRFSNNSDQFRVADSKKADLYTPEKLKEFFGNQGLPVRAVHIGKKINKYSSSMYQDWQRENLGSITVSDFDLFEIENEEISAVIELKRSKIPVANWEPYREDYPNFRLVSNILAPVGIPFKLIYNHFTDSYTREDDLTNLKLYNIDFTQQPEIQFESYNTLEDLF